MNEDAFNMSVRKFLKVLGVTSQREIEQAVRAALAAGTISGREALTVRVTVSMPEIGLDHKVNGDIALE